MERESPCAPRVSCAPRVRGGGLDSVGNRTRKCKRFPDLTRLPRPAPSPPSNVLSLIKRYRELLVVSALLLYPFVTFLARGRGTREPNVVDRAVIAISATVQRAAGWTIDGVGATWNSYVNLRGVKEQNDRLRAENAHLRARVQTLSETQIENERLRRLLGYASQATGQEVTARVIAINPVPHPFSLRIDRGSDHGVRPGTGVITADGVVGQVIRATGGYADVMTVKDPNSRTSVAVQRSRARATAAGVGGDKNP